ncbi:hypothetical protein [Thermoactinomyces mirandus]|uniref:Uncharacterized protein n=1 Tax=Thermoactinomyces mirandus TaxID=2756294 RepID=A0A7W1XRT5_9BACL|nr:hypothetical protein [Thermoactinomyces mirandus]MBA4602109.1 hypothetical protein [Thermoactinomyces mirandus]
MDNIEIVIKDFRKENINSFIYEELRLPALTIKSSHFYDHQSERDLEFAQVKNMKKILSPKGTGYVVLEKILMGIELHNVVMVFSFDEENGDIVINFPENEIFTGGVKEIKLKVKKILDDLIKLRNRYEIGKIIIGYEPAEDQDTKLIELNNQEICLEKVFERIIKGI